MRAPWRRIRPGWYVLAALTIYAVVVTAQWRATTAALREARLEAIERVAERPPEPDLSIASARPAPTPIATREGAAVTGLWLPVPGARVSDDDTHLPGALRAYRAGVSQGFTFWPASSGVPITHGTPVVAAGDGEVIRADEPYAELSALEWDDLVARVADGADDRELDMLRGRQVWLRLDDGRVVRYGHLASVRSGLTIGSRVERGRVVGTVGNSGTGDGVAGRTSNARLHFEVWDGDTYLGQDLEPDEVRLLAADVFVGP